MKLVHPFQSKRLWFRTLEVETATGDYHQWLRDPAVNQYLEVRHHVPDIDGLKAFIRAKNESPDDVLLGIFLNERHIGNIKLGPIVWAEKTGTMGILIGDRSSWGKGYATEAIATVAEFAIHKLQLEKIVASCYDTNLGSYRAFMKAGFKDMGREKNPKPNPNCETILKMEYSL